MIFFVLTYIVLPKEHVNNAYLDVLGCPRVSWGIKTDRSRPAYAKTWSGVELWSRVFFGVKIWSELH